MRRFVAGFPLAVATSAMLVLAGCGDSEPPLRVTVRAEVIDNTVPVMAASTDLFSSEDGRMRHGVQVQIACCGALAVQLDDARFTHHVEAGDGHLVTAGRGCSAEWDENNRRVQHVCTADLQVIELQPGESNEYTVTLYPRVGPLRLQPGVYVVEQPIGWRPAAGDGPGGRFTVRLTYGVR